MRNTKVNSSLVAKSEAKEKKASRIFKPLVASSLALALGMSVGNATDTGFYQDGGNGTIDNLINFTGGTVGFGETTLEEQTYKTFQFDNATDGEFKIVYTSDTSNAWSAIDFDNKGQLNLSQDSIFYSNVGVAMGDGGTGTLTLDSWTANENGRTFIMELSSVSSNSYAFYGNLSFVGNKSSANLNALTKVFTGNFGGLGIKGNITLNSNSTININFLNNAGLTGGVTFWKGSNTISFHGENANIGGGVIVKGGDSNTINASNITNLTIVSSEDAITTSGGTLNITANNLILRRSNNGSALWSNYGSQINITIKDGGSFSTYKNNDNTLTNISIDRTSHFTMNFEGSATINSIFQSNNVDTNTITMNFGSSTSNNVNSHNVVFKGSFNNNGSNKPFTSIFNFQNDGFTFALQNASGTAQGITYSNTRSNAINFNANNGVFDLGENALTISGTLGINLGTVSNSGGGATSTRTATTNTINSSSIASSGTTTITFNADSSTLSLKSDGSGVINVSGGTTAINFDGSSGILAGSVNTTAGTTTINIADDKSGTITRGVTTTETGITNINFENGNNAKSFTLQGENNQITTITSGGTQNTLALDTALNSVSTEVTNAISGSDSLTITLSGTMDKIASLTLNNADDNESTIKALTLTNTSSAEENILNLSANKTTIASNLSIDSDKGLTINLANSTELASGVTNLGNATINFNGESETLTGTVNTDSSGTTIFNLGFTADANSNSNSTTAIINGTIANTDTNTSGAFGTTHFNINAKNTTLQNGTDGLVFETGTNVINFENTSSGGATLNWKNSDGSTLEAISTTGGSTAINFNQDGILAGGVNTDGTNASTTIAISSNRNGIVKGDISLDNNGQNIVTIDNGGTLTLQGTDNQLTSVSSTTSGTLKLDGYNSVSGVSANLSNTITDNATILNFNGTSSKQAEMTLSDGNNKLKAITLGNGSGSATSENKLILSTGNTSIAKALNIGANQGIAFDLGGNSTLTFSEDISNASALGTSGGGLTFNIKGGSGNTNTITGNISTGGTTQGVDGTTTFNIADSSSGVIVGNITISANTDNSNTNINFENGNNAKSFALQGENNQITNITSNGSNNTLKIDSKNSVGDVNAVIKNAVSGADSLTIILGGTTDKVANLTLNNANSTDSTIETLSLSESNSSVDNNVLNLQARKTSITSDITVSADQGLTINLANAELASGITNSGNAIINFNGTTSSKLTGDISTSGDTKTTTFNVVANAKGFVDGSITLSDSGSNIVTIDNGGTLTLQGEDNQLTSVTSTTSGILSLDGASNSSGVTASVSNAIQNSSTTLNFNGTASRKAEMTLSVGDNTLKAITLGANATNNKLILYTGSTNINDAMNVGRGQEITFDLGNNTSNNTSISFADSVNNSGGIINILNNTTSSNGANITLKSLSISGNGTNTIGKSSISSSDDFDTKIDNAFVGTLKITEGISSSAGSNDIFFKATSSQNSTVIASDSNAISATGGINNIYLDIDGANIQSGTAAIREYLANLASSPDTAHATFANNAVISGDITGSKNGTINLKIIGTANAGTSLRTVDSEGDHAQIGILGNIQNNGGDINIILKDTIFAPSQLVKDGTPIDVGGDNAGNITTTAGTTTVVTRFTNASLTSSGVSMYNINNSESGTTNIILQGNVDAGANVKYGSGGAVNLIFANNFDETNTNFSSALDVNKTTGEVSAFGTTYQDGIRLTLQDKTVTSGNSEKSFLSLAGVSGDSYTFSFDTKRVSDANGNDTDTVTLRGVAVGEIASLSESAGASYNYNITLDVNAIYLGSISLSKATQTVNLTMNQGSKLFSNNDALAITNLTISDTELDRDNLLKNSFVQNSTIIDLATDGNDFGSIEKRESFRLLLIGSIPTSENANISTKTITGLTGSNALFRVYVNPNAKDGTLGGEQNISDDATTHAYSDRIIITNGTEGKHYIQAIYNNDIDVSSISYQQGGTEVEGNIAVATVKTDTGITFEGVQQIQGFDLIGTALVANDKTDIDGSSSGTEYTTYFIESVTSTGASPVNAQVTTSALGLNYELFLANFNSLNKRMGELRNNDNGQGAWGRIFNGMLSTSYGLETTSIYTTIQAGYDYAFGFEGANNYLGVALSYANSMSKSSKKLDIDGSEKGLNDSTTHGVEVALYNSYVEDSGWFNDTIVKFSYMMSDLNILGQDTTYNSNNYGLVFSDEFGYRFKLGSEKEWYIDPQLEIGFGYFNQSNLKQVLGEASLDGIQDAIMTLRARVGANWAYDFKRFTQGKEINASVYVGTYYSYDYINGGEISLTTNLGKNTNLTPLASTGRFELNVGTNVEIKDNTRIYFDFERSFGGTITTEYQVNVGVRYSFGESNGYKPIAEKVEFKAPLKVDENNEEKNTDTEESNDSQDEAKNVSSKSSTKNKTQPKEKSSK